MKMIGNYQPSGFAAHERGTEQNPKSIINLKKALAALLLLIVVSTGYAQVDGDYRSKSTPVSWAAAASWQIYSGGVWIDASVYPGQGAGAGTVTIQDGHTVTLNAGNTLANAIDALVVGQGGACALNGDGTNRNLFITNGLTVSANATFTPVRTTLTVGGNTSINGTMTDNNLNGSFTFAGSVTINNGGTFTNSSTSAMNFRNGLTNNGTFSTSGAVSFTVNPQSIDGTNPITIAGTVTVTGITVTNNSPSLTLSSTGNPSLTGTGEFEQGVNSLLRFNGSSMNNASLTLDFTATGNKVVYYRNNTQTIAGTTYHHLVDSVSNTKTLGGNVTVNGNLDIKGTATLACSMYQITGNPTGTFTMESGTTLRLGSTTDPTDVLFPTNFTNANISLSGTSTVHYQNNSAQTVSHEPNYRNLTIATSGSTKTATGPLNVALALLVNTGATLTTAGDLTVGTTLTVATSGGTLNMDASATALSVTGAVSIPGTLNLGTNLTTVTFGSTCAVAGSLVFDGTSTKTVSITGNLSGAGSIDMSGGALAHHLILGGATNAITTFTTAASSTVTYQRSGTQSMINSINYRNLIIRNSGLKSCTGTLTVAEDFTIDSLASFNPGGNAFTVSGNTLLYYGTFADNSATNTNSFQDVELNGGVISGSQNGIVNINGNLSVLSGNGTIGRAAVTVSGTTTIATNRLLDLTNTNGAKTFNGLITVEGTGRFRSTTLTLVTHLLLGGGVDVEASGGQFTAGGATFTASQSLLSAGTLSFGNATTINAGVTVVNHSSQGITLTGTLNGVNATTSIWVQGSNSVAYYRSATQPMATGVLNADSTGNFWHYNASAAQAVKGTTYYNLVCSGGGSFAKTLQAGANVDGVFQLDTLTLFNPVNFSMTISGPSTITGTIGDSNAGGAIDFEDVNLSGGTIHHASSNGTFRINGNLTMPSSNGTIGRGIVTVYGTTTINNGRTLTLSTNNAGVKNFIGKITLNGSGIFNSSAITTASNLDIEGGIDVTNVAGYFNAGTVLLSEDQSLEGEGEISFGAVTIASGMTVRNYNRYRVEFNGVLNGGDASSTYVQEDSTVAYYQPAAATAPMVTGVLDASATGNTFHYCRSAGAQNIGVPLTAYHHITVSGGNTKSLSAGTTTANGKLRIESGTTLQVAGNTISVGDSAIVDGTFDDNNSAGTNTFTGHLLVSGTGTLSTTTNSAFTFEGGFTNNNVFSKTGTGSITFSGSNQDINGTGEITLSGNITINTGLVITYKNTNSTGLTLNGILNGQTGTSAWVNDVNTIVNYTSSASANSPMATGLLDASATGNAFNYNRAGAQTVKHPVDGYYNLSINGSGTKTLTGNTLVGGNLVIELGTTLDVDAAQNYAVAVNGNLLNSGIFAAQTGTITFSGTSDQIFDPSSSTFHNITIDMDAAQLTLSNDLTMNGTLTLTDGVVTTGSNTLILTSTNANSLVGFSSGSFVNGNLRRYITTNTSTYSFPVGNGTASSNYYRADLINNNLQGINYLDASFIPLDNHDNSEMVAVDNFQNGDLTYTGIHPAGVWRIEPDDVVDDGSYGMRLYTQNMAGLADNDFGPLKRPVTSVSGADWTPGSGTLSNNDGDGRLVAHGYALRTGWDSFSEFGVGHGSSSGSGLPIELVAFNAVAIGAAVEVTWQTATETNNEHFTIERSADGETFTAIAAVDGAGNSSEPLNYRQMDYTPLAGTSYYRLKQTDYNGDYTYSNVVSVNVNKEDLFTISPNPVTSGSRIVVRLNREELTGGAERVEVTDLSGKTVFTQLLGLSENPTLNLQLPTNLSTGVYMVSIKCLNNTLQKKILVQ